MKILTLTTLAWLLLLWCLVGCAKPSAQDQTSQALIQPVQLSPSLSTCLELQGLTAASEPVQLSGYADGGTVLIEGLVVSQNDGLGNTSFAGTSTIPVGTYCVMNVVNNKLQSVTMDAAPGCAPGWGQGC